MGGRFHFILLIEYISIEEAWFCLVISFRDFPCEAESSSHFHFILELGVLLADSGFVLWSGNPIVYNFFNKQEGGSSRAGYFISVALALNQCKNWNNCVIKHNTETYWGLFSILSTVREVSVYFLLLVAYFSAISPHFVYKFLFLFLLVKILPCSSVYDEIWYQSVSWVEQWVLRSGFVWW